MRVLQIGADRSKRGILFPGTPAFKRQEAYAKGFGALDIIGFSRKGDGAKEIQSGALRVLPTNSLSKFGYILDALRIAKTLQKPDVVSAQDPFEAGLAAYFIARRFGVPLHIQVHTDFLSPAYARFLFLNRIRVLLSAFILRRAKRVRAASDRIKQSIERRYRLDTTPITTLPIFVDVESLRRQKIDDELARKFSRFETRVLVVARLEPEKKVGLAIGFFAQTAPQNAALVIVGDGTERHGLETLAEKLKVSSRVFFEGSQDAKPYYSIADLVLVTSEYEGYGLVTVEALAAGKPVISTDVGNSKDVGAMNVKIGEIGMALAEWFENGPRIGELKSYPYRSFEEYVRAYCADIEACARG